MNDIKVLLADDHRIVRLGLATLIETEPGIRVVGNAENGIEATRKIRAADPAAKVLVLTSFGISDGITHALDAGAGGALMKTADDALIISAIRTVAAGRHFLSPEVMRLIRETPPVPVLSPRQRDVLKSMTLGLTNKEIANQLGIRKDGVEDHINVIFQKLGASNRAEAVAIAMRKQLLKM